MEVFKGGELDYKEGKIVLTVEVAAMALPVLAGIEDKINSGEIDLVKGTDLDKDVLLQAIGFLKVLVSK